MPRTKLTEKEYYRFSFILDVRISDINYGKHVGGTEMMALLHTARAKMYAKLGVEEDDLGDSRCKGYLGDFTINFLGEALMHDILTALCHIDDITENGFRIYYCIKKEGKTILLAESGVISFDKIDRKTAPIPDKMKIALESL